MKPCMSLQFFVPCLPTSPPASIVLGSLFYYLECHVFCMLVTCVPHPVSCSIPLRPLHIYGCGKNENDFLVISRNCYNSRISMKICTRNLRQNGLNCPVFSQKLLNAQKTVLIYTNFVKNFRLFLSPSGSTFFSSQRLHFAINNCYQQLNVYSTPMKMLSKRGNLPIFEQNF